MFNMIIDESSSDTLNLDTTAMIAMVSELTHGLPKGRSKRPGIQSQFDEELRSPLKPQLDEIINEKRLVTCQESVDTFKTIIKDMAGPKETERAQGLLQRLIIVPSDVSNRFVTINRNKNVTDLTLKTFGVGDKLKVPTLTSNRSVAKSVMSQFDDFLVLFHPPRSLTELEILDSEAIRTHQ